MREPHAKCVKIPPTPTMRHAYSLGFLQKPPVAPPLLRKYSIRVDSVDGIGRVRGLFAKTKLKPAILL
jgi:hypothetical protein